MAQKPSEKVENIKYSKSFGGVVVPDGKGGKRIRLNSLAWYQNEINKFREGEQVTLVIHNKRAKRSLAQNAYYWGVYLPLIAKETGERNLDRLHELFKGLFLTSGVVQVLGKAVRMKKSTTELNKAEFGEFIMSIEAETGIAAPPTQDLDGWGY